MFGSAEILAPNWDNALEGRWVDPYTGEESQGYDIAAGPTEFAGLLQPKFLSAVQNNQPNLEDAIAAPEYQEECCRLHLPIRECRSGSVPECGRAPCMGELPTRQATRAGAKEDFSFTSPGFTTVKDWEENLLADALVLLRKHIAIHDWLCCMYSGAGSEACQCMRDFILGHKKLKFKKRQVGKGECISDNDGSVEAYVLAPGESRIFICQNVLDNNRNAPEGVSYMAGIVAHEIGHLCRLPGPFDLNHKETELAQMAPELFPWFSTCDRIFQYISDLKGAIAVREDLSSCGPSTFTTLEPGGWGDIPTRS